MKTRHLSRRISVLLVALVLAACGRNDSASMVASAKAYLEKNDPNAAIIQLKNALQQTPNDGEARVLLARALLDNGDPTGAETEVRKAIEFKYSPDQTMPLLGRVLLQQRDFPKMISELSGQKLADPQAQADLLASLAFAYIGTGKAQEAHAAIDAALAAKPQYSRAQIAQAQLAATENNLPAALELIDKVLAQTPDDMQAMLLKSDIENAQGHAAQAVKTLERLVEQRPDSFPARFALFTTLTRAGQVDIAAAQLDSLKKLAPKDVRTMYAEAVVDFSRGNMRAARDAIQQVLSVAPEHLPSLLLSGLVNFQLGSYSAAEDALRKVVAKSPDDRAALRALIATYLRTGRTTQAFEVLEPAMQRAPNDPALMQSAAEIYLASNNPAKAAEMYEKSTALDKTNVTGQVRLAQVRMVTGDTERAFKDLEAISEANPALPAADLALISAHLRQREPTQALAAANALEKKQPDNPLVHNIKGVIYASMHNLKEARASFDQALKLDPGYTAAITNLAQLDYAEHNVDGARKRYEQLLVKDPKNEEALLALAGLLSASKAPEADVRAALDKAIAANPGSVRPRILLIGYYAQQKNVQAALAAAQAAQAAFPENPQILEILGTAQQAAGESNQAIETFTRAAKLQPESPTPLLRLAGTQASAKDFDGAIETLRKAIALQPEQSSAWLALAKIYAMTGRTADGIAAARKLQKEYPNRAGGFALEGQMLLSQKKPAEAAAVFKEGLAREPLPFLGIMTYASLLSAGKPDQAAAMAQRWYKEHPKDTQLHAFQAQQAIVAKDYKVAVQHYRAVLAVEPDNAMALNNLAWALNEQGDPKALEIAERASVLAPNVPTVMDTRGWILVQRGDAKKGLDLLREASGLAPDDADIRLHLAKALLKTGDKAAAKSELETLAVKGNASPARTEAQKMLKEL